MPLIILVPVLFAVLGALVSYAVARWQKLEGRALWAAIAGGVIGGAVGGVLTVPAIGMSTAVAAGLATTLPETTAGAVGTAAEFSTLAVAQGVGSGVGQASSNLVNKDPVTKDVAFAVAIGAASQLVLAPVGDKLVLAASPVVPVAARTIGVAVSRVPATKAVATTIANMGPRWAGETTTEALTDGATMVVPPPGEKAEEKPARPEKGIASAVAGAVGN